MEAKSDSPPWRMCIDCGAEEAGWHCGYQVLVMGGDTQSDVPHSSERSIFRQVGGRVDFVAHRGQFGNPLYLVGQSHPNFAGGGRKTYEELTEVAS